jgi:3-dehydroquinate synthase
MVRPLLAAPDPLARVRELKASRQPAYALAHWTVHTDGLTTSQAAAEVVRAWELLRRVQPPAFSTPDASPLGPDTLAAVVHSSAGSCPIYAGLGVMDRLGEICRRAGLATTAYLLSDEAVFRIHGRRAQAALEGADIPVHILSVPAGEASKSLETAAECYRWLAERRAERSHFLVALGGGVVGDLGGFVAATFNRGIPCVQIPTSLAAMVDASIGGKTAVDLPQGKNLVGAFHQPRFVLADVQTLTTLPQRELASGWAEAIKHGFILDADLFHTFEEHAEAIVRLEQPLAAQVIRRSAAIKADVVSRDERETLGIRTLLNYGHTVGHALEAATGYGALLHGEAVAVGMAAAARISRDMGLLSAADVERQDRLLQRFGLPTSYPGADREALRRAMGVDKKTAAGAIHWVLLEGMGRAVVRADVPEEAVEAALGEVVSS